ncbi:MAG: adenylate/guanylate cyclase domain-containing protein [Candidatus Brocadia sp.]|nr:adenylate/guanylate cyclase domain-containing protein [Candidatus Brocadia sp.]
MEYNTIKFSTEKEKRIVLFCDLRNSTDILMDFEQGIYRDTESSGIKAFTYAEFIMDVHETSYKELYLGHENTYAEIYGDGVMGIFPEDNTKYILENIYSLTKRMRTYNDSQGVGIFKPRIDIGFGITVGEVSFIYYPLDKHHHPVGRSVHEAARIEGLSRLYDARVLVSDRFFRFAEGYISTDQRFSYRFIDRIILKGFREPITLFELLIDNDPRFEIKKNSIKEYSEAYSRYCRREWGTAKELFQKISREYGLGIGAVMAKRCDFLAMSLSNVDWNGIWSMKDK